MSRRDGKFNHRRDYKVKVEEGCDRCLLGWDITSDSFLETQREDGKTSEDRLWSCLLTHKCPGYVPGQSGSVPTIRDYLSVVLYDSPFNN